MKHPYLHLLLLTLPIAITSTAIAASQATVPDNYYQVEVIVFKNNSTTAGRAEVWPPIATDELPLEQQTVQPNKNGSDAFSPLPATQYQLQGIWDALERSTTYEPLVYAGWLQPQLKPDAAKAVQVAIGSAQILPHKEAPAAPVYGEPVSNKMPTQTPPAQIISPLMGEVTIASDYYLYANLDFIYTPDGIRTTANNNFKPFTPQVTPATKLNQQTLQALANGTITLEEAMQLRQKSQPPVNDDSDNDTLRNTMQNALVSPMDKKPGINGYRLKQNRRIKLNEIHYFDHPQFGVIIQVSPYESAE